MKKILIYGVAVAAIAGCSTKEETKEVKVFDASCEKVAVFEQGDMIVKCPTNETLSSLQDQTPTGIFVPHDNFNVSELAADAEHVYVNVIPAGAYEWAPNTQYRVMVKEPNFEAEAWAVSVVTE